MVCGAGFAQFISWTFSTGKRANKSFPHKYICFFFLLLLSHNEIIKIKVGMSEYSGSSLGLQCESIFPQADMTDSQLITYQTFPWAVVSVSPRPSVPTWAAVSSCEVEGDKQRLFVLRRTWMERTPARGLSNICNNHMLCALCQWHEYKGFECITSRYDVYSHFTEKETKARGG